MISLVIQYKHYLGQLTSSDSPSNHFRVSVSGKNERDAQGNLTGNIIDVVESIDFWDFPEPQPTVESLKLLETDAGFLTWLSNRPTILAREKAKQFTDEDFRIIAKVVLKVVNNLSKYDRDLKAHIAAATSLADLKTRAATLDDTPNYNLAQFKAAMDSET